VLANPAVTSPIVGASRPDQLEATLAAAETRLDEAVLAALDDVTRQFRWGDAAR
jgi:aryl-alcohol dehydrogenase-like predicted oxidoreductase